MNGALKHITILGAATGLSIGAYHLVGNASDHSDYAIASADDGGDYATRKGNPSLARMPLLTKTMYHVNESYVEPQRVEPKQMFEAALRNIERRVPEVLFRFQPGGKLLHMAVGSYTTTLELPPITSTGVMIDQLTRVGQILEQELSDEVDLADVEYALINGVLGTLDPHSVLLPPEASKKMDTDNAGEFGGLGITITMREGRLTVEYPLEDTPAYAAGLKPDDKILRIDGESTINMELQEAVSKLRGRVGTKVTVSIQRAGWKEPKDIAIERATIKLNPVKGDLLEGGIGYVRITNFHANVSSDLHESLNRFRRTNGGELRGLVLDLRGNPGGYLHQAIEVSDTFLSRGTIVSQVDRSNRNVEERGASLLNTEADYPIVVLVNANSASASEIVAGALKNQERAIIVGERTFGKGSVQNLFPNDDTSKLKLTTGKYLTPGDRSIQAVGIPPDVLVEPTIFNTDDESGETRIFMYARERVTREGDLDQVLEQMSEVGTPPVYSLRYFFDADKEAAANRSDKVDVSGDWEVQFARDVILASPNEANRAQVLSSIGRVVKNHGDRQKDLIGERFEDLALDWSTGPQPASPELVVEFDLGEDDALMAGEANEEVVWVRVTNAGDETVHQLMAVTSSEFDYLDGDEFYFGKLEPGETRSWPSRVRLMEGYRDEVWTVDVKLQDAQRREFGSSTALVRTIGSELPAFNWTTSLVDDGSNGTRGDGDGIAEAGETVALKVLVENTGSGPSKSAFAKVKNRSDKAVDLQVGTSEIGVLDAGASHASYFVFQVKEPRPELELELIVGDGDKYDYAAVWRGGFYQLATLTETVMVPVGKAYDAHKRTPPVVEVSRSPGLVAVETKAVISGVATDPEGVRDVIVYQRAKDERRKVFYQGGEDGVSTLPYTVDAELEPGWNLFVVVARDQDMLSTVRSISVWHDPEGKVELAVAPE